MSKLWFQLPITYYRLKWIVREDGCQLVSAQIRHVPKCWNAVQGENLFLDLELHPKIAGVNVFQPTNAQSLCESSAGSAACNSPNLDLSLAQELPPLLLGTLPRRNSKKLLSGILTIRPPSIHSETTLPNSLSAFFSSH